MRVAAVGVVVAGLLVAGCGTGTEDGEASARPTAPSVSTSSSASAPLDGDRPGRLAYPSPEALAKASSVVVLGTIASWEDGPSLLVARRGGGQERVPYAVAVITVDQVIKDRPRVASGATIAVPVRLDDSGDPYEVLAPAGSNVAYLGGGHVEPAAPLRPAGPVDADDLLWAEPQGLIFERPDGTLVNADPDARAEVWPDVVAVPAGEQFGTLAQRLMALRG